MRILSVGCEQKSIPVGGFSGGGVGELLRSLRAVTTGYRQPPLRGENWHRSPSGPSARSGGGPGGCGRRSSGTGDRGVRPRPGATGYGSRQGPRTEGTARSRMGHPRRVPIRDRAGGVGHRRPPEIRLILAMGLRHRHAEHVQPAGVRRQAEGPRRPVVSVSSPASASGRFESPMLQPRMGWRAAVFTPEACVPVARGDD